AISYSKEETLLGTGGGLKKAACKLKSQDPFLLLNGDTYFFPTISKLKGKMTMALRTVENGERYGTVLLDRAGKISSFIEKNPGKGLINGGVYLIHPSLLKKIPSKVPLSLEKDLLPNWIGELYGMESTANFIDIGVPSDYLVFNNQVEIWQKQKS
ncbi:MAG TPA: sugar phosphate nucleotidyltransferase, partial [Bdellovibrionota bacterium]|nr:sugar phosphate nucleotidyltransferase [Bdellovibrionota bacterium]